MEIMAHTPIEKKALDSVKLYLLWLLFLECNHFDGLMRKRTIEELYADTPMYFWVANPKIRMQMMCDPRCPEWMKRELFGVCSECVRSVSNAG